MSLSGSNLPVPYVGPSPSGPDGVEIVDLLRILWRRRGVMAATIIAVAALGYWSITTLPIRYTAEASLVLEVANGKAVDVESVVAGLNKDTALINSEVDVLQSRNLAERVVDDLGLMMDPEFNVFLQPVESSLLAQSGIIDYVPGLRDWLQTGRRVSESTPAERIRAHVVASVLGNLLVENDGASYTVRLYFEAADPTKAAAVANGFAELYLATRLEAKREATERAAAWLKDKLDGLRREVTTADRAVQEFREQHQIINVDDSTDVDDSTLINQQLARLGAELIVASAARARAEAALQEVRKAGSENGPFTAPQIAGSPLVQELRSRENALLAELAELRAEFGARHARIIEAENQLREVQGRLNQEAADVLSGIETNVDIARAQERALEYRLAELEGKSEAVSRATIQLRQLTSEANAARSVFDAFIEGFNRTSAEVGVSEPNARILSRAIPPLSPSYPPRTLLMVLTAAIAVLLALVAVAFLELMDRAYRNPADLERAHGVAIVGLIPQIRRRGGRAGNPSLEVVARPLSRFTEAVHSVRASLAYTRAERPPKVILITSAVPDEGKSTVAIALGRLAACTGERVLLVDCDLRRPSIAGKLGHANKYGLVEFVDRRATIDEVLCVDEWSGMKFLPAIGTVPFPVEIFNSEALRTLLADVRDEFDMIILDSPPIGIVSDALVLSTLADATLLMVRWGKTPRAAVTTALKKIAVAAKPVTAAVFSHVNLKRCAAYSYSPIVSSERYFADLEGQWQSAHRAGR
jgi:polysaccharide biosynthesis transport protein